MLKRYVHTADAVFALVLFCVFAMSMLLVLMTGARAYQEIRGAVENRYSENTCTSYITTKVRHYDEAGAVALDEYGGVNALCLTEVWDGEAYVTYIYYYDGYVREFSAQAWYDEADFDPAYGQEVLAVTDLGFELERQDLLRVTCVGTGGGVAQISLSLRSGEGVA